jgi:hypothetical protein
MKLWPPPMCWAAASAVLDKMRNGWQGRLGSVPKRAQKPQTAWIYCRARALPRVTGVEAKREDGSGGGGDLRRKRMIMKEFIFGINKLDKDTLNLYTAARADG